MGNTELRRRRAHAADSAARTGGMDGRHALARIRAEGENALNHMKLQQSPGPAAVTVDSRRPRHYRARPSHLGWRDSPGWQATKRHQE